MNILTNLGLGILLLFSLMTCQGGTDKETATAPLRQPQERWKLICLGDDVVIGRGLDPGQAFPAQLEQLLQATSTAKITVVNAGIKGETSVGANERIEWILQQRFDAILLALGANEEINAEVYRAREEMIQKINRAQPTVAVLAVNTDWASAKVFLPTERASSASDIQLLTMPLLPDDPRQEQEALVKALSEKLRRLLPE